MVLLLGLGAPVASAAPQAGPGWSFKANFGGYAGIAEPPRSPLAVDGSGNIFSAESFVGQIHIYSPSPDGGTEFAAISGNPRNLAIDSNTGSLYVDEPVAFEGTTIRRYLSDGQSTPTYTLDPTFEVPQGDGIAVDPTTGNLLVADPGAEGVRRYDSNGTLLETIATPSINPSWILAMADGSFYVAPAEGPDLTHFTGAGAQLGTISGVGLLHGLAYDASRSVVVVAVGERLKSYSPAGALLAESMANGGSGVGLAVSASGLFYEQLGNSLNLYVPGTVPGVEAPHVASIAVHSVHVSAEVDPGAGPPEGSVAHFEASADGGQTWPLEFKTLDVPVERTGSEEPDTVEADLADLRGNADYLVRLVAGNSVITTTSGSTSFHTSLGPPEVDTGPAISITDSKAELTGTVDTLGDQTTYRFEYGLTTSYGSKVPTGAEAVAGNERGARAFARGISGLQPATTYHYRLVAKNSAGEGVGADRTFTTGGAGAVRGYEQVSPRNKMGGSISPGLGFQAAADGTAVEYQLSQAPGDASSATVFNKALSRRTSTGWLDWDLLNPPVDTVLTLTETVTHAVSSDFAHSMVVSNRVLAPGGIEGGGNIYIQDLDTGEYTFVGGAPGVNSYLAMTGPQTSNMYLAGASDFSWVVFSAPAPLLSGITGRALYRWSRIDGLEVESRLPDGSIATGEVQAPNHYESWRFRAGSDDGEVVYFSLTSGEAGLYRRSGGQTTAVSVSEIPGDPDTPKGAFLYGSSSDGRYAFFGTGERLTTDTPENDDGPFYIYRYDAQSDDLEFVGHPANITYQSGWGIGDDGQTIYFAKFGEGTFGWKDGTVHNVTSTDLTTTSGGGSGGQLYSSPNGRYLAYFEGDGSIHLYNMEREEAVCVSCGPGDDKGKLPLGGRYISNRPPEVVNDNGEMYFDTSNNLVAEDHNSTSDVYQYHDGHLKLISPGDGPYVARFGDATPDGGDVFFTTNEGLVPGDVDRAVDVYDARLGGGFPEAGAATPECIGEACRPPIGRPPDLQSLMGDDFAGPAAFAISKLRPLSAASRRKLAMGGTVNLRLSVSRPGTVTVVGGKVDSSPVKAKRAGAIGVPFSLSNAALAELKDMGRLSIKLSVHFGDASPRVVRLTLNAVSPRKGGRS